MVTKMFCAAVLVGLVFTASGVAQEVPPLTGLEDEPPEVPVIEARVSYWIQQILLGETAAAIVDARRQLLKDYDLFDDATFQYRYATNTAGRALGVLAGADPNDALLPVREINAAMAVANMDQISTAPTLQLLVAHPNPGVRLWGWRGYALILPLITSQGGGADKALMEALDVRLWTETSALVRGAMLDMMTLPETKPEGVSDEAWRKTGQRFLAFVLQHWREHCSHIAAGESLWIESASEGLAALVRLWEYADESQAAQTDMLQAVVDLMWVCHQAYQGAADDDPIVALTGSLMLDSEDILKERSGIDETFVKPPLTASRIEVAGEKVTLASKADRSLYVADAVYQWLEALAERNVAKPDIAPAAGDESDEADSEAETQPAEP